MKYCLDTSALIEPWRTRYPIDIFPTFWNTLDEWAEAEIVLAPDEVRIELKKIDDELLEWVNQRRYIFRPPEEDVQLVVSKILAHERYKRLVDTKKGRSIADPWVIAQAQVTGSIVVTEEQPAGGRSPKIPDVCEWLGVKYTSVLGLIRAMKIRF